MGGDVARMEEMRNTYAIFYSGDQAIEGRELLKWMWECGSD
jgi:hypothetical protein